MNIKKLFNLKLFASSVFFLKISAFAAHEVSLPGKEDRYIESAGYVMGSQTVNGSVSQFGLNEHEKKKLVEGVIKGLKEEEPPINFKEEGEAMQNYLQQRIDDQEEKLKKEQIAMSEKNKKQGADFIALEAKKNSKIQKTESGLYYEILDKGSVAQKPSKDSEVKIHYVGKLIDGTEFDSSRKRGEPAQFNIAGVIPGFSEGLQLIGKGGKIKLFIPSDLGYQDMSMPNIPAGSTLLFEVELLDVISKEEVKAN